LPVQDVIAMYTEIERFASDPAYRVFVDIGVRSGGSSLALSNVARKSGGIVYGIDYGYCTVNLPDGLHNYTLINGESVTVGRSWQRERPDFIFIDATHVKEWLMCELYYWWDLLSVGGTMAFHDTNWEDGRQDIWGGRSYATVDEGLGEFFQLPRASRLDPLRATGRPVLNYEDRNIRCANVPDGDGLTFVLKKTNHDYKAGIADWPSIFGVRAEILRCIVADGKAASDYCDGSGVVSTDLLDIDIDPNAEMAFSSH
jgi:Methyltransferase domain